MNILRLVRWWINTRDIKDLAKSTGLSVRQLQYLSTGRAKSVNLSVARLILRDLSTTVKGGKLYLDAMLDKGNSKEVNK